MIPPQRLRAAAVPLTVGAVLLGVYGATLARDVTFWDAGEFIAAAADFGIPHPPGTPLYILILRTALLALGAIGIPVALATSLVSALMTAAACAIGAHLLARATGDRTAAIASGIAAGTMATVWLNATETEVYAASLALSLLLVHASARAAEQRSWQWALLSAYLVVLAVPLHLSALLAAPAAIYLAVTREGGGGITRGDYARGIVVGGAATVAYALSKLSVPAGLLGVALLAAGGLLRDERADANDAKMFRAARAAAAVLLVAIAASALLVMLLRARHDPDINQGNPSTIAALLDVIARRQYAVADLWPRQAPFWLQVANLGLYADWQVALTLGPTIFPTLPRTVTTCVFAVLGLYGAVRHVRMHPRSGRAFVLLFVAGTIGAAIYLNLKAGPSFGHGILPPGAMREARERDYFFVLGWWTWGAWIGYGAVTAARALHVPAAAGLALALVPLVANWRVVDRTREPEASLPRAIARGLLESSPRNAVLFVAGDNDTYPLWYAQQALGVRSDVTVITTPLLPAQWYRRELARRDSLVSPRNAQSPTWWGRHETMRDIATNARRLGRPVVLAMSMGADDRAALGPAWTAAGPVLVEGGRPAPGLAFGLDTTAIDRWSERLGGMVGRGDPAPATDGTMRYVATLLRCPGVARSLVRSGVPDARVDSLAPFCNFK